MFTHFRTCMVVHRQSSSIIHQQPSGSEIISWRKNCFDTSTIFTADSGCQRETTERKQDTGCRMQDTGFRMQDTGCMVQEAQRQSPERTWHSCSSVRWRISLRETTFFWRSTWLLCSSLVPLAGQMHHRTWRMSSNNGTALSMEIHTNITSQRIIRNFQNRILAILRWSRESLLLRWFFKKDIDTMKQ